MSLEKQHRDTEAVTKIACIVRSLGIINIKISYAIIYILLFMYN